MMLYKAAMLILLITFIQSAFCVVTIRNAQGKALRNDYVQQIFSEQQQLLNSYHQFEERKQKQIFDTMFLQADDQKCDSNNDCLNGGICYEKACYCKTLYVGNLCQYQLNSPIEVSNLEFILICIGSVILGILLMILINYILRKRQEAKMQREGEYTDNKFEIWQQKLDN